MQSVWNKNRLVLLSSLLLLHLLFHPALGGDEKAVMQEIGKLINANLSTDHCQWTPFVTCDSGAVKTINLNKQNLKGPLPDLSNLTSLVNVYLDDNPNLLNSWDVFHGLSLTGSSQLVTFSAKNASLTGPIPDIIVSFPNLKNLHLAYNKIEGPLPKSLGGSNITTLWLNNQEPGMSADLSVIGSMLLLQEVWLHVNQFTGTIPDLSNCTKLESLSLRDNTFSGSIHLDLTNLANLTVLNVTHNNQLSGTITVLPKVVVNKDPNLQVIVRNSSTPASGITPSSSGSINPPPGSPAGSGGMPPLAIAAIVIVVIIVAAVVVICVYRKSSKKRLETYKRPDQQSDSDTTNTTINMDVLIQVTDDFSEAKIIGRGGFGTVYRGKLPYGPEVAVKRMVAPVFMSSKGMAEYKAEIEVLSKVKHKNLVGLIGFCENGNERLLVYEFMPQGTLGDHLFDWRQRGGRPLTWSQRVAIALDVARGVDYLHNMNTDQSFIHRDLKPNNILLGDDMRAKVADFGLVKNAGSATESIQTKVAGTFGYFAPEYWETGRVTTKVDVYAFGVILMEIISGRKVVDDSEDAIDSGNLMLRFRRILAGKEDVRGHIDPTLHADDDEETYRNICEVVELAGHCTVSDPQRRCDIGHAVSVLGRLVEHWTPSNFGVNPDLQQPNLVEQWKTGNGMSSASYTYA